MTEKPPSVRPRKSGKNPAPGIRKLPRGTWNASKQIQALRRRKATATELAVILSRDTFLTCPSA
jgi:hypothetical protein